MRIGTVACLLALAAVPACAATPPFVVVSPDHVRIPLGHDVSLNLTTSGFAVSGDWLAVIEPDNLAFQVRSPDADAGLYTEERIDLPEPTALGAELLAGVPF